MNIDFDRKGRIDKVKMVKFILTVSGHRSLAADVKAIENALGVKY